MRSRTPRFRQIARLVREVCLNAAATLGAACIVLLGLGLLLDASLMMFKTGSMAPAIPAGSVALVREVPASEIQVGDIVTVDRSGQLPITHRVTSIQHAEAPGASAESRTITMKGDANLQEDPAPYTVSSVRTVLFSVPGGAAVIVWMSDPRVLGSITVLAALFVTWTFWPRSGRAPDEGDPQRANVRPATPPAPAGAASTLRTPPGSSAAHCIGAVITTAGLISAGLALTAGASPVHAAASPGSADATRQVIAGDIITLTSIRDTQALRSMVPGVPVHWQVGIQAEAPEPGVLHTSLHVDGDPSLQLELAAQTCTQEWIDQRCAGEQADLAVGAIQDGGSAVPLFTMAADQERWLLLTATVPPQAHGSAAVTVGVEGMGDSLIAGPDAPIELPRTGQSLWWMLWLGLGLTGMGLCLAFFASRANRGALGGSPLRSGRIPSSGRTSVSGHLGVGVLALLCTAGVVAGTAVQPTLAAWQAESHGQGRVTAAAGLRPVATVCTDQPEVLTDNVLITWEPGRPGTRYTLEVRDIRSGTAQTIDAGQSTQRLLTGTLSLLGVLTGDRTLEVRVTGHYTSPSGHVWTTENPQVVTIEFDPGFLVGGDLRCL